MRNKEFEELVGKYSGLVLNVALRILGNADSARDVHQEVFLAIWRTWDSLQKDTNWRGYLYRVTVRKAFEFIKQSSLIPIKESENDCLLSRERPDAAILTKELWQKVTESLAHLPERQAEVFVLSRIEGLNYEDISEIMGCSQSTVRVHLHRALERLAQELKSYLGEWGGRVKKCTKK